MALHWISCMVQSASRGVEDEVGLAARGRGVSREGGTDRGEEEGGGGLLDEEERKALV